LGEVPGGGYKPGASDGDIRCSPSFAGFEIRTERQTLSLIATNNVTISPGNHLLQAIPLQVVVFKLFKEQYFTP
jgi:hypothetical protein